MLLLHLEVSVDKLYSLKDTEFASDLLYIDTGLLFFIIGGFGGKGIGLWNFCSTSPLEAFYMLYFWDKSEAGIGYRTY